MTAVVVHEIAMLIWNQNIRHVDAAKASILSNLEPFVTIAMGSVLLYKPITRVKKTMSECCLISK
ncbi:EamA family transporter [Bacillus sp. FJAT-49732]|uniref:EamA family transporter n=1 Tax=Lederbergia citrisecunda TaxID=2833583 RepID=A0A942TM99_9BACI|nr:EamA family transporter [Lederbergia citrisecunda]MBS4200170.1 EamA family transporter [Lederbergia citrisecunda]